MNKSIELNTKIIISFMLLSIVSGTTGGILQMLVPLYAISINANTIEVGLIRGISGIGLMLMVVPSGFLVDYYGSKRLYVIGGLVTSLSIFMLPLSATPILMMSCMAIQGFGNSLRFTSLNAAFFKYLRQFGLSKAGWYKGSMSIGLTFIGPFIGGYIVDFISYKIAFILTALMTLFPSILVLRLLVKEKVMKKKAINFINVFREQLPDFKFTIKDKMINQVLLIECLTTACFASFMTFILVLLVKDYNYDPRYASWMIILEGGSFILTVFLGGNLLEKYKTYSLYLISFILSILGLTTVVMKSDIAFLVLGIMSIGIGLGMANLINSSQVSRFKGEKGKISGLLSACAGIGSAFGPMIGGVIGQIFGIKATLICYVPLFIIVSIYIILNREGFEKESIDQKGEVTMGTD